MDLLEVDEDGCGRGLHAALGGEGAPLVRWVFEQYATGENTVVSLLTEATARGLTTVPTPKRPSGPVGRSTFFKLLRNPYYIGIVRYKGAEQSGTHEPLVDVETWQQVQRLLDSRKIADERRRTHNHYLKGTLFCGQCGSRMQLDYPANKQGVRYAYYVCSGRTSKRKHCTRRAVPVGIAEQLVADCYRDIAITESEYASLAAPALLTSTGDWPTSTTSAKAPANTSAQRSACSLTARPCTRAPTIKASDWLTKRSPTTSRSAKTKGRRSDSLSRSPPSHQHRLPPMSGVLVRLKLWT
ncbi:recombinase family protein [Helcobacillus sp. ACRRO]|uniref:recombinase family protein n=1 Tax=Helcobacillus sp. ACRRO TaxID=2918202 RepID=UPI001EF5C6FC|nr:recombinase family protein [Helcobacillus sp. ACRRO]